MNMQLMYITNDPDIAVIAQKYGVQRIWIDLERLGKAERQKNMNTVKSNHCIGDIRRIKPLLTASSMLVRINPWNPESEKEIESVIRAGADLIMLPMWKSCDEVRMFLRTVGGRAKTILLLETKEAVNCVDQVLDMGGFDEIHIGLNDLHLSYGLTFMFELLSNGTVESLCQKFKARGIAYGFGGIAKIGDGLLPAEKIIVEHYRLGSTRAILSRTFCDNAVIQNINEIDRVFRINMEKLRMFEEKVDSMTQEDIERNTLAVKECVDDVVKKIKEKRNAVSE